MLTLEKAQTKLLLLATECPWASAYQLATHAKMPADETLRLCDEFVSQGFLQRAELGLSRYPRTIFAPTNAGVFRLCEWLNLPVDKLLRHVELTEQRFWTLRSCWEVAAEVHAMCALTATSLKPDPVRWQTLIERRFQKSPLFLHGRLAVEGHDGVRRYYLLNEREDRSLWNWYGYFKYLTIWARRLDNRGEFPPLLAVTTRPFRAEALLALNRMAGGQITTYVTPHRAEALARGLAHVKWYVMLPDAKLAEAAPFAMNPCVSRGTTTGVHEVPRLKARPARPANRKGNETCSESKSLDNDQTNIPAFDMLPSALERLPDMDRLDDAEYRLLRFIIEHPVCPGSAVASFTNEPMDQVAIRLSALRDQGFVEEISLLPRDQQWLVRNKPSRSDLKPPQYSVWQHVKAHPLCYVAEIAQALRIPPAEIQSHFHMLEAGDWVVAAETWPKHTLWTATDLAVRLFSQRTLQPTDKLVKRHGFFRADHRRRIQHTRAVYSFFDRLRDSCQRLSAANRRFDAPDAGVNAGDIVWCELGNFESELVASDWYEALGKTCLWRPDGYGVIRAGATYTPFWLELDGHPLVRSRREGNAWERKLGALCDYIASGRWKLKSRECPQVLVVSSLDVRLKTLMLDVLNAASRSRDMTLPHVFMTSHQALSQQGPLGKIWFRVEPGMQHQSANYAFPGVGPRNVVQPATPHRRNLLDELASAESLGLLG